MSTKTTCVGDFTCVSLLRCAAHGAVPSSVIVTDLFIAFRTAHVSNTFNSTC